MKILHTAIVKTTLNFSFLSLEIGYYTAKNTFSVYCSLKAIKRQA